MPDAEQIRELRRARERLDLYPMAVHANYLVNLASGDAVIRAQSIVAFRRELERAAALGAEYLVVHPGSFKGRPAEEGLEGFALALRDAAARLARNAVTVLLENTVGCGTQAGGSFEELRAMRDRVAEVCDLPLGYCLDTCHLLAANYDVVSREGLEETIRRADAVLGLDDVKLMHANDSKQSLGSRRDRHENIGEGYIGKAGFRRILAHPKLREKPFILETPKEQEGDDRRNMENLKNLCPRSRTTTTRLS